MKLVVYSEIETCTQTPHQALTYLYTKHKMT